MKTGACLILLVSLGALPSLASYEVRTQDDSGISLSFDFTTVEDVLDETGTWVGCRVPDFTFSLGGSLGLDLPAEMMLFAVPARGDVRLSISNAVSREIADFRSPSAPGSMRHLAALPQRPAEITSTGFMRNQRIAAVRVSPLVFDRDTGRFRLYEKFDVRLTFEGARDRSAPSGRAGARDEFDGVFKRLLVNYEQGRAWRRLPGRARLGAAQDDYFTSSGNWVKVKVESTGIHALTGTDLAGVGVNLNSIDPASLRLYGGGGLPLSENLLDTNPSWMGQMALRVSGMGDGRFDPGDSLIFYALGMRDWTNLYDPGRDMGSYYKSFFSDFNYYWITWGGSFSSEAKHMASRVLPPCDGCAYYQPPSFLERVHVERDALNDFSIRADDGWYWRPLRLGETVRLSPDTPFPDHERDGTAKVRVADYHGAGDCIGDYYRLIMRFNGETVTDSLWRVTESYRNVVDIHQGADIDEDDEQRLEIIMSRDIPPELPGNECGMLYLAWYEVIYWRRFVALENRLNFFSPDSTCLVRYETGGFTRPSVYAFDITDQYNVVRLEGFSTSGSTSFQVSFYDSASEGAPRRYALAASGSLMEPVELTVPAIADIRNRPGNEYLVITHDDLMSAALTISDFHDGEIVTVDQIYDEFAWGVPDVTAIRDFLRWRLDTGATLHHVLLLGDATWDYKGYHATGGYPNYVPAYERRYLPPVGDPYCTDDFFGYLTPNLPDGSESSDSVDYFLDVAMSRLPAPSPAEAELLVEKAIAYQTDPPPGRWQTRVCQVADDDKVGSACDSRPHTMDMENINDRAYPVEFERTKVYLTEYPLDPGGLKPAARADFIAALNSGVLMANFVGHGDEHRLAQEEVLNPSSIPLINTGRKEFFFIAATCNVSRFDEVTLSSMCEDLLKRPNGGTIGSLASTHFCIPQRNKTLNINFVDSLYYRGGPHSVRAVSDAMVAGKALTGSFGGAYRTNSEMFALFGDPALELFSPEVKIEFNAPSADTLHRKGTYRFSGSVMEADTVATWFNGTVDLVVNEAQDTSGYMACNGFYDYELPGGEIFRGKASVTNGAFSFDFFVSTDTREGPRGQARASIYGGGLSGLGLLDSIAFYGEIPATDTEGPVVTLLGSQGAVDPGDTLTVATGDRLRLNLEDSSGVAIRAKSEFIPAVSISVDDGERTDLTDSVYAEIDDFRASHVYFNVPAIPGGVHDLVVSAFDNLNNLSQESFKVLVESPVEGETNVVYAFPNPVSDFCHIICEYERTLDVEICMYTVTGREIWRYESPDARSYHEIPWRGRDAAGDAVANGTYLVRVGASDPDDPSYSLTRDMVLAVIR